MTKKSLFTVLSCCVSAIACYAYSPNEIIDAVLDNGAVKVMQQQNDAERESLRAKNYLKGPEAQFDYLWGRNDLNKWSASVSQSFDWPGVYSVRRQIGKNSIETGMWRLKALRNQLRLETTQLLVKISFAQQRIDELERNIADLTEIDDYLTQALDKGIVTILDKKKASIELVSLEIEKDKIVAEQDELVMQLNQLAGFNLNLSTDDRRAMPDVSILQSRETYLSESLADPAVMAQLLDADNARLEMSETYMSALPSFNVGYVHEKEESGHYNGFSVGISLPSWGPSATKKASRLAYSASLMQVQNMKNSVSTRVNTEYDAAVKLRDRITRLRVNGIDGNYMSLLKEARKGGEITMLDYLREQVYVRNVTMELIDLEESYALLLASLNRYALDSVDSTSF